MHVHIHTLRSIYVHRQKHLIKSQLFMILVSFISSMFVVESFLFYCFQYVSVTSSQNICFLMVLILSEFFIVLWEFLSFSTLTQSNVHRGMCTYFFCYFCLYVFLYRLYEDLTLIPSFFIYTIKNHDHRVVILCDHIMIGNLEEKQAVVTWRSGPLIKALLYIPEAFKESTFSNLEKIKKFYQKEKN